MIRFFALFVFAFSYALISTAIEAKRLHNERWYQEQHCQGVIEHRLEDGTRVDCLHDGYAYEYDFASKWAEGIGQSIYYSAITDQLAGVVLILEKQKDCRHIPKIKTTIKEYRIPIQLELIAPDGADGIKTITCQ